MCLKECDSMFEDRVLYEDVSLVRAVEVSRSCWLFWRNGLQMRKVCLCRHVEGVGSEILNDNGLQFP